MADITEKNRTGILVKVAVIVGICLLVGTIVKLEMNYNELYSDAEKLNEQIEECKDEIEQLNIELSQDFDDEYVMRIAREKLNYYMPDEILYYGSGND